MTAPMTLEELAERVDATVAEAKRIPSLDAARAALNESGLQRARAVLRDAPAILSHAQDVFRSCQEAEKAAKACLDEALADAEWPLDDCFAIRGNKTWLVKNGDGTDLLADQERTMTATEKKEWLAREAAKQPKVIEAAAVLRDAENRRQAAADSVVLAERGFVACRLEVEAAIAHLQCLALVLPYREAK